MKTCLDVTRHEGSHYYQTRYVLPRLNCSMCDPGHGIEYGAELVLSSDLT